MKLTGMLLLLSLLLFLKTNIESYMLTVKALLMILFRRTSAKERHAPAGKTAHYYSGEL